jgi:hypothetical protein
MLDTIVVNTKPTDVAGMAVVAVGILGFANVVPASDALSTWVMIIGIAAIFGPRMYRRVLSAWATRS